MAALKPEFYGFLAAENEFFLFNSDGAGLAATKAGVYSFFAAENKFFYSTKVRQA